MKNNTQLQSAREIVINATLVTSTPKGIFYQFIFNGDLQVNECGYLDLCLKDG